MAVGRTISVIVLIIILMESSIYLKGGMNKMKKYLFISLAIFLSFALISAALVDYLSNKSKIEVEIKSPLEVTSKTNSELFYGGEEIYYKAKVMNNINKTIEGVLTLTISNDKSSVSCEDFSLINLEIEEEPSLVPIDVNCVDNGEGIVKITRNVIYPPFSNKTYLGTFGLKLNIEPASYKVETQVMNFA